MRGRIRYDPEKTTVGHLYHEVNHLEDFISNRVPAPFQIHVNDAADFQQLRSLGIDTLIEEAEKRRSPPSDKEKDEALARTAVAEIRNSLRDIENLQMRRNERGELKLKPGMESQNDISRWQIKHYSDLLNIQFKANPMLKQYVRTFMQSSFPEIPNKYRLFMGGDFIQYVGL